LIAPPRKAYLQASLLSLSSASRPRTGNETSHPGQVQIKQTNEGQQATNKQTNKL
jgi:hypothetical protein